jgi:SAM-dependent methyltransferase
MFADMANADPEMVAVFAERLEGRAQMPGQRAMLNDYLSRVEFRDGARVLEVGSGTGPVCRAIASLEGVIEVVGVEPSPEFVRIANEVSAGLNSVRFEVGDGAALSFDDDSFDVVVMHTLLSHVPDQAGVLGEAHRVLKPGGSLAIFDADFASATVGIMADDPLERCIDAFREGFVHDPYLVRHLVADVAAAGFEPGPLVSHGLAETTDDAMLVGWIEFGAGVLASDGRISEAMARAYVEEGQRRLASGAWFSFWPFASLIARNGS